MLGLDFFPPGAGGGLSWGTALYILHDTTEKHKKVMGCAVLHSERHLDLLALSSSELWSCLRPRPARSAKGQGSFACAFSFFLFFSLSFLWRHHMLVLCLYECFNHFHGGRILYLCSCTILFFSARKSVMYEINQSHLFENKSLFWTL